MKNETSFSINPDNPGDFFACLGVLYCADKIFEIAEGYFKEKEFILITNSKENPLDKIITKINSFEIDDAIKVNGDKSDAAVELCSFNMHLDFWNHFDNRPKMKLFAGQETSRKIISRWIEHIKKCENVSDLRGYNVQSTPSGFDTMTSWNALDTGFSINEQKMSIQAYPLIEFFAYIGVQTYAWEKKKEYDSFYYRTWSTPIPITIAKAVAAGALKFSNNRCFKAFMKKSGQKKVLKRADRVLNC